MKRSLPGRSGKIIGAIMLKDLRLYGRNKIYVVLTVLTLACFGALFWLIPGTVEETITLAISPPLQTIINEGKEALRELGASAEMLQELEQTEFAEEGLELVGLESAAQLRRAVEGTLEVYRPKGGGDLILRDKAAGEKKPKDAQRVQLDIGIAFPDSFIAGVAGREKTTVTVYANADVPEEIRQAMQSFVREIAYQLAGRELPVELPAEETIILGPDRSGAQASMRDKMRPLLAFFALVLETYAMASLISTELLQRTVTALLVTPMKMWHFLAAKTLFGTGLALLQGLTILVLVGAFTPANWLLLLTIMLLGSLLFTGVAMLIGAAGKDFLDQLIYALLFSVPLMIPAFAVLFPGTAAAWVRVIPSYPIAELLANTTIYGSSWRDSLGLLGYALLWGAVLYAMSLLVLKRKVESL
ncbi:MAG TPA: ABC transporter permease [Bacillota bacterium]|nr:ABC transporter permease [Bacillota bacterium]HOL15025.1 ABC transporter permease [Bacillota bacterium]